MNDILTSLIVVAVTAVAVAAIFWFSARAKKRQEDAIRRLAAERGWTCEIIREPLAWGMRLSGPDWRLEAVSRSSGQESDSGSSNVSQSTRWQADRPGRSVLVGARPTANPAVSFGAMLIQQTLRAMLGDEDGTGLSEVKTGNAALDHRYMIWARDLDDAEALLTPAVTAALLDWKDAPLVVKRTASGLQIEIAGRRLQKEDELIGLVRIGEALLAATTPPGR
jgi:hypothetical protein